MLQSQHLIELLNKGGIGLGIMRALKHYPSIAFDNDIERQLFTVTIARPPTPSFK